MYGFKIYLYIKMHLYIDARLIQERRNFIANALELRLSWTSRWVCNTCTLQMYNDVYKLLVTLFIVNGLIYTMCIAIVNDNKLVT